MNVIDKVGLIKPKTDFIMLSYISLRHAYVYQAVGKAANSTVKQHLYDLEYSGTKFKTKSVHERQSSPLLSPYQLPDDLLDEVFYSSKYFRFTVVRNPFSRILSCYLDRIVPGKSLSYRQLIAKLGRSAGDKITFEDFVGAICAQKPFEQNNHWRLQKSEICMPEIQYDFVGKQESFASDMQYIWSKIAPGRIMPDFAGGNSSPSVTSAASRLAEYYSPALADLVRAAYHEDFKTFGYSLDLA